MASAEKLEHTGLAVKERVVSMPQREQLASMPEPPLPTGTEPSVQSIRRRESQGEREPRGRLEQEHGEKRVDSSVKESRFQRGKEGQTRRTSLGEVEESMSGCVDAKSLRDICRVLV